MIDDNHYIKLQLYIYTIFILLKESFLYIFLALWDKRAFILLKMKNIII